MIRLGNAQLLEILSVLMAAMLWGTTGTVATFALDVGAVAISPHGVRFDGRHRPTMQLAR